MHNAITHRRINDVLTFIVIGLGLYLLLLPVIPQISYWINKQTFEVPDYAVGLQEDSDEPAPATTQPPDENRLVIPSIALNEEIHTGTSEWLLSKGPWHKSSTGNPDDGSNMVISGHRFTYENNGGARVFYNLDKVSIGDRIGLYWDKSEHLYEVQDIRVVEPTAVEIENPTEDHQLTIYTCTPLWSAAQRLAIIALPINDSAESMENAV